MSLLASHMLGHAWAHWHGWFEIFVVFYYLLDYIYYQCLCFPPCKFCWWKKKRVLTVVNPSHTLYHGSSIRKRTLFANPSGDYYFLVLNFRHLEKCVFEKNLENLKHKMCFSSNLYIGLFCKIRKLKPKRNS
jgi:hypothetical protein